MKRWLYLITIVLGAGALTAAWRSQGIPAAATSWQRHASPGALSRMHAPLEDNCAACHPVEGPADAQCAGCHANETALLRRQPTAFHAVIGACARCHIEHQGVQANLRRMSHSALARIGLARIERTSRERGHAQTRLLRWVQGHPKESSRSPGHPQVSALEATLNCRNCHATKDRHSGLFGRDCAACHGTEQWTLEQFQHPSPDSPDCARCHRAPSNHGSARCYECHQTTSWDDVK